MSTPAPIESRDGEPPAPATLGLTAAPQFKVLSVDKTPTPPGGVGRNWYRYVLGTGTKESVITGHRRGSMDDVRIYAAQCVEQLNTRARTAASPWSLRGRKPGVVSTPSSR